MHMKHQALHNQILNDKTIKNDSNKTQSYLPKSNGQLINHSSFSLAYNEQHEQAIWYITF